MTFSQYLYTEERDVILQKAIKLLFQTNNINEIKYIYGKFEKEKYLDAFSYIDTYLNRAQNLTTKTKLVKIITFGGLFIEDPQLKEFKPEKIWGSIKAKELFALLLILSKNKGITREILSSYLWPEKNSKKAKNNFHVTLSHIRKVLGNEIIICEEPFYKLNTDNLSVDYYDFNSLFNNYKSSIKEGKIHLAVQITKEIIKIYQGDFLPEMFSIPILDLNSLLKNKMKEIYIWLIDLAEKKYDWNEILSLSHKLLQIDPFDERGHRYLMMYISEKSDRNQVIKHYRKLSTLLKKEFEVEPENKTKILYKSLINS